MGMVKSDASPIVARRVLLLVVAASLVSGVLGGLARLGVYLGWGPQVLEAHGPLLVFGAFTTVIAVERAVALGGVVALAVPTVGAVGAVALTLGATWAPWANAAAAVGLVALNLAIVARQRALHTWLMLLGAAVLAWSAVRWAGSVPTFALAPAWLGFFVLTIAAERLELSRLAPTPRWAPPVLALAAVALAGLGVAIGEGAPGSRPLGVALAAIGVWQLRFDLARRVVRRPGLPRYAAIAVLGGAAWLVIAGALLLVAPLPMVGPRYDAVLHAVLIGYVLSMVFAHAPIILPAVARLEVPFARVLYAPLALLHASLGARVLADLVDQPGLRRLGAMGNAVALIGFALAVIVARVTRRTARARYR